MRALTKPAAAKVTHSKIDKGSGAGTLSELTPDGDEDELEEDEELEDEEEELFDSREIVTPGVCDTI
jgi:hypothetical protein